MTLGCMVASVYSVNDIQCIHILIIEVTCHIYKSSYFTVCLYGFGFFLILYAGIIISPIKLNVN